MIIHFVPPSTYYKMYIIPPNYVVRIDGRDYPNWSGMTRADALYTTLASNGIIDYRTDDLFHQYIQRKYPDDLPDEVDLTELMDLLELMK